MHIYPLAPTVCGVQLDPFSRVLLLIVGHCVRKSHQEGEATLLQKSFVVTVCVVGETDVRLYPVG